MNHVNVVCTSIWPTSESCCIRSIRSSNVLGGGPAKYAYLLVIGICGHVRMTQAYQIRRYSRDLRQHTKISWGRLASLIRGMGDDLGTSIVEEAY